ncbi:hypothetical protein KQX54_012288 [Cotesia glomerata]|uniref:Protein kinase domain-containing protein n=1 Tax=Cotesia glomerata TaxID=32391 RepID=A0AAV7HWA2_COTGL|nr:hypothetical protein KQX54_012288 [Cotesia glomerata]
MECKDPAAHTIYRTNKFCSEKYVDAVTYLHQHNVVHRNIKGDNILLTNEGEVKLADYGFAKHLKNSSDLLSYRIGSPSWMAPEVAACEIKSNKGYSIQADVWSVGITAIELAEGRAPYQDMHPSRILFQTMRNPPPGLHRASNWSVDFVDFIAELCKEHPSSLKCPALSHVAGITFLTVKNNQSRLILLNL